MIKKEKFIKFLNYIGITNERLQAKIYKYYQKCYNKQYRRSELEDYLILINCETAIEEIRQYVSSSQYRTKMNIEVSKYGDVWGKDLNHEIIL